MAQPESAAGTGDFLREILDLAIAIELECAGVYEVFASQFTENEELATFWRLYAEAERYHAATIRLHQATFTGTAVDTDSFPTEVAQSRAFLEQLRAWRKEYAANKPSLTEAFTKPRQIEGSTAELHGRTQFFKVYPSFEELFTLFIKEDEEHRQLLDDAESRWVGTAA